MAEHNELGKWGEDEATLYLENEGYVVIDRDWKAGKRDLDILAVSPDGKTLVVVEVKTRSGEEYQQPEEAVDVRKMRRASGETHRASCGCLQPVADWITRCDSLYIII